MSGATPELGLYMVCLSFFLPPLDINNRLGMKLSGVAYPKISDTTATPLIPRSGLGTSKRDIRAKLVRWHHALLQVSRGHKGSKFLEDGHEKCKASNWPFYFESRQSPENMGVLTKKLNIKHKQPLSVTQMAAIRRTARCPMIWDPRPTPSGEEAYSRWIYVDLYGLNQLNRLNQNNQIHRNCLGHNHWPIAQSFTILHDHHLIS